MVSAELADEDMPLILRELLDKNPNAARWFIEIAAAAISKEHERIIDQRIHVAEKLEESLVSLQNQNVEDDQMKKAVQAEIGNLIRKIRKGRVN